MKKNIWKILSYVLVAAVASVTTIVSVTVADRLNMGKLEEVQSLLDYYFVGEVDQSALEDAAASAMVEALGDEWSYYMTAEEYEVYKENLSNSYVGVGITVKTRKDLQGIDIVEVEKNGPAVNVTVTASN